MRQAELFGEQLKLSTIFSTQPPLTAAARLASKERYNELQEEIVSEIEEAKDRIKELKDELETEREELDRCEIEDYDLEPEPGDECLFGAGLPEMEREYNDLEFESETEIRLLECKIAELEAKLKHAR